MNASVLLSFLLRFARSRLGGVIIAAATAWVVASVRADRACDAREQAALVKQRLNDAIEAERQKAAVNREVEDFTQSLAVRDETTLAQQKVIDELTKDLTHARRQKSACAPAKVSRVKPAAAGKSRGAVPSFAQRLRQFDAARKSRPPRASLP